MVPINIFLLFNIQLKLFLLSYIFTCLAQRTSKQWIMLCTYAVMKKKDHMLTTCSSHCRKPWITPVKA